MDKPECDWECGNPAAFIFTATNMEQEVLDDIKLCADCASTPAAELGWHYLGRHRLTLD